MYVFIFAALLLCYNAANFVFLIYLEQQDYLPYRGIELQKACRSQILENPFYRSMHEGHELRKASRLVVTDAWTFEKRAAEAMLV